MTGKVLILDDDAAILELTALYLNKHGFVTLTSLSAASAVKRFDEVAGDIDILIADLTLPGSSGVEVAAQLQSSSPALKTLFVSGYAVEDWFPKDSSLLERFPADSFRFLRKPYSGNELITKLVELIGPGSLAAQESEPVDMGHDLPQASVLYETVTRQVGLLELAHDAIIVRTLAGDIRYWNQGAETLYGWTKDQVRGRTTHELLRTFFPEPFQDIEKTLLEHRRWEGELHHTKRDGSRVVVSSRWAVRDAEDNQIEILEINRDISDQKRVEMGFRAINRELQTRAEELQRAEQMFRSLLESAPDAMVIVDAAGQVILVNGQTENLFGYQRDELLGKSVDLLVPDRSRDAHARHRARYVTESHIRPMSEKYVLYGVRKSGEEFPVEISLSPIETGTRWLYCSAIRDISERKPLEITEPKAMAAHNGAYLYDIHHS
jgi:PAS domain S-box-containing protein